MKIKPLADGRSAESQILRAGLPKGASAPAFSLPLLHGGTFDAMQLRGSNSLIIFSDPGCGPCTAVLRHLPEFTRRVPELEVIVISRGSVEANADKISELQVPYAVALQNAWEVSRLFGLFATPSAFLIDPQGLVSAPPAVGFVAILRLVIGTAIVTLLEVSDTLEEVSAQAMAAIDHPQRIEP